MEISDLTGFTLTKIEKTDDSIIFHSGPRRFMMHHHQDCCESVHIKEVVGDLKDLIGHPLLQAEEETQKVEAEYGTWTFYKLATIKGAVTITWLGISNGYYSEAVNIEEIH